MNAENERRAELASLGINIEASGADERPCKTELSIPHNLRLALFALQVWAPSDLEVVPSAEHVFVA